MSCASDESDDEIDDPAEALLEPTRQRSLANRHRFEFLGNGQDSIVAIFKRAASGTIVLVGTGFFVSKGVVATASHVFVGNDVVDGDVFEILQVRGEKFSIRQIQFIESNEDSDVAACLLHSPSPGHEFWDSHPVVGVMELAPERNEVVGSFTVAHTLIGAPAERSTGAESFRAQPVRFRSHWELGTAEEVYENGRSPLKGRCYQPSVLGEGRGSGGPLFNSNGFVIALNSLGGAEAERLPYSIATSIRYVMNLPLGAESVRERRRESENRRVAVLRPSDSGESGAR